MKKKSAEIENQKADQSKPEEKNFSQQIGEATKDLLYSSETDAGFETVNWTSETGAEAFSGIDAAQMLRLAGKTAETPIREIAFGDFFRWLSAEQDWYGDEEKETAQRYKKLAELLEQNLRDVKVFKIGTIEIEIYAVGVDQNGGIAGIKTRAVET